MNMNYLNLARVISLHSDCRIRVGAVIVRHGCPVSIGNNHTASHPHRVFGLSNSIHAEIDALCCVPKVNLQGSTVYVARHRKNGSPALARPCESCWLMLKERGVKWVVYTTNTFPHHVKERIC